MFEYELDPLDAWETTVGIKERFRVEFSNSISFYIEISDIYGHNIYVYAYHMNTMIYVNSFSSIEEARRKMLNMCMLVLVKKML
jgi:hypothetical protein